MLQVQTATKEQLENAITKIEESRPCLSDAIRKHRGRVGLGSDSDFQVSPEKRGYDKDLDAYWVRCEMVPHLKVALSVVIANEYVSNNL